MAPTLMCKPYAMAGVHFPWPSTLTSDFSYNVETFVVLGHAFARST